MKLRVNNRLVEIVKCETDHDSEFFVLNIGRDRVAYIFPEEDSTNILLAHGPSYTGAQQYVKDFAWDLDEERVQPPTRDMVSNMIIHMATGKAELEEDEA